MKKITILGKVWYTILVGVIIRGEGTVRTFFQLFLAGVLTFYLMVVPSLAFKTEVISPVPEEQAMTAFKPSGSIFEKMADAGLKRALTLGYVQKLGQEVGVGEYTLLVDELISDATRVALSFYFYANDKPVDNGMASLEISFDLTGANGLSNFTRLQGDEGALLGYTFTEYTGKPREIILKGRYLGKDGSHSAFNLTLPFKLTATTLREVYVEKDLGGNPEILVKRVILAPTQWAVVVNLKGSREELEAFRNLNMPLKLYSDGNPLELLGVGSSLGGIPPSNDEYFYFQPGGQEKGALLGVNWPDGKSREIYLDFTKIFEKPRVEIAPIYENLPQPMAPKPPVPAKPIPSSGQSPVPVIRVLKGIDWVRATCKELLVWIPEKNFKKIREIADERTVLEIKDAFRGLTDYKLELVNFNYQEDQKGYLVNLYVEIRGAKDNSYRGSSELMLQFVPQKNVYKLSKFTKN